MKPLVGHEPDYLQMPISWFAQACAPWRRESGWISKRFAPHCEPVAEKQTVAGAGRDEEHPRHDGVMFARLPWSK